MALKYECDVCHIVKDPSEFYGKAVLLEQNDAGQYMGRPVIWEVDDSVRGHVGLSVMPWVGGDREGQVCRVCTMSMVMEMAEEFFHDGWTAEGQAEIILGDGETREVVWETDDGDSPVTDREDSDVPELRASESVPQPGPDEPSTEARIAVEEADTPTRDDPSRIPGHWCSDGQHKRTWWKDCGVCGPLPRTGGGTGEDRGQAR